MVTALPFTSAGTEVVVLTLIPGFFATITVIARFWSRFLTKLYLGFDDWLVLIALIAYCAMATLAVLGARWGASKLELSLDSCLRLYREPESRDG